MVNPWVIISFITVFFFLSGVHVNITHHGFTGSEKLETIFSSLQIRTMPV